jgi:hypothetical protein
VQLLLRSGTGRILLQNERERHAHKAISEVVMSLYCVLKKGHYVFCAVQNITIVQLLTEMLYYFLAV